MRQPVRRAAPGSGLPATEGASPPATERPVHATTPAHPSLAPVDPGSPAATTGHRPAATTGNGPAVTPGHRPAAAAEPQADGPSRVSLVIPAKNEARNLPWVLEQIPDSVSEVILVDGESTDATLMMATVCRPDIRIVAGRRPGKGYPLRSGFAAATGDVIVMLDADGSMSPQEIPRYLYFLENGYDFVKGSRFVAGGGSLDLTRLRSAGNRALLTLVNSRYRVRLTDLCYGFCAFRRCYLQYLRLQASGFEIEAEMVVGALRAGLRIAEVPSLELPRRSGRSNLHALRDGTRVLRTLLHEHGRHPASPCVDPEAFGAASPG